MREIELCPSCYGLTVKQPHDWFCIPCVCLVVVLYGTCTRDKGSLDVCN